MSKTTTREKCLECGNTVPDKHIMDGSATHKMLTPDSHVSSEEWETVCCHCVSLDRKDELTRLRAENEELKEAESRHVMKICAYLDQKKAVEIALANMTKERDEAVADARVLAKEVESLARRMFISMDYDRWQDAASGAALEALTRHTGGQDESTSNQIPPVA